MNRFRKAISVGMSAALLASLMATVAAPAAFGASGTLTCQVTGSGTPALSVAFGASAAMPGNWQPGTTFGCTNNATPAGVVGGWVATGGQVATVPAITTTAATIVLGSAANPSSASVSFTAGDATVATITFNVLPLAVGLSPVNLLWTSSAAATATNAIGNGAGAGAQANATYSGSSTTPASAGAGCTAGAPTTAALAAAVSTATSTITRTAQGTCQAQFAYTVANTTPATVTFASFTVSVLSSPSSFWDGSVTATGGGTLYTDNATTSAGSIVEGGSISASVTRATATAGTWTATGATPASSTADSLTFTVTAPAGGAVTIQWQSPNGFYHRFSYTVTATPPPPGPVGSGASAVTTSGFGNVTRAGSSAAGTFTLTEGAVTNFADGTITVTPNSSAGVSGTGTTAVWFDPASTPTATVTSGIGSISASVSAGGVLTITISGATGTRLDNFTVSGLKVKAGATAALGAVQFRYTTTGTNAGLINSTASGTLTTNTGTGVSSPTYTLAAGSLNFQVTNTGATPPISNATFVGGVSESVALTGVVTANFSTNHPSGTTFSQTVQAQWFPQGATVVDTTKLAAVSTPVVLPGVNSQTAGNLTVTLGDAGFVPAASTLTFAITTPGVQFSALPTSVTDTGDFAVGTGVLSFDRTSVTYTVTTASTTNLQVLTLGGIAYDVALSATAGALVNVTLTISGGVAVSGSPAANAQIAQTIIGSGAVPTIIIGNNDQATGLLTIRESAAGTLPDDTTVTTDKIVVCTTTGETFSRAPWFVVTAGDLKLNVGGVAATQAKATLSSSACAFVQVYSASTVASTIEVRAGVDAANTAPKPSGPTAGATVNVGIGLLVGPTLVQVSISATGASGTPQGAPVVVAMRALAGTPIVAAVSQPLVQAGGMNQVAGNVTITEGAAQNFVVGEGSETISLCLVTQALTISTDTFFANTAGVGMPIVSTNNATSGLVASIAYSSPCFVITINNPAVGALGVITVSGLKYNVNVGTANGPVFLQVKRSNLIGVDFNQVVSNATIGTMAAVAISADTALGATKVGPFSTTTKVAALNKYVTWRFRGGSALAGKTVQIAVATKNADGSWGAFTLLTARLADASGNAYFSWRSSSAKWISVRAYYAGDATHNPSWSAARQGRWR